MADVIRFTLGAPEVVALKFSEGKSVAGKFGEQMLYTCVDGRTFYLDCDKARDMEEEIGALGIRTGEAFRLTKIKTSHGGSRYDVEAIGDAGGHNVPRRAGAFVENTPAPRVPAIAPALTGEQTQNTARNAITPASAKLMACFMQSIDAIAEAQAYAARKGLGITFSSEDVRATAISCWINSCREGGR